MQLPQLDPLTVQFLTSFAAGVGLETIKGMFRRLESRRDPFEQVWLKAVKHAGDLPDLQWLALEDAKDAFRAGLINSADDLAQMVQDAGIHGDRVEALLEELVPALNEECRQLALSAEGGAEQAHRIISEIEHRETRRRLEQLIELVLGMRAAEDTPPPARRPDMAPPPPENFVDRPGEYDALVGALVGQADRPVGITTALEGGGGFGKTALARAICHDPHIRDRFEDGILWAEVGQTPGDLTPRLNDWITVLGGDAQFAAKEAARAELETLLSDRSVLIAIDDVWHRSHLNAFPRGGQRCARLITTRIHSVLPADAIAVPVDRMQPSEAVALLGVGLPRDGSERLSALAERLGRWAVLLKIINGVLRERVNTMGQSLDAALDHVEAMLDERGLTAFDVSDPQARDKAVRATVEVSLDLLTPEQGDRYHELAIFPEGIDIPIHAVDLPPENGSRCYVRM